MAKKRDKQRHKTYSETGINLIAQNNHLSWKVTTLSLSATSLVGILCYSNTFNSSFHFDDISSIIDNPAVKDLREMLASFPSRRFITFLSFAINYYFGELNVFGYHLINIIIHILNALTIYWFMRLLLISEGVRRYTLIPLSVNNSSNAYRIMAPLLVALLFVAHPIQTQAVTYISQRATSLSSLFYMLSMSLYLKYAIKRNIAGRGYLLFSLISALLAMLTKEISFTLPIAIILIELYFFSPDWEKMRKGISSSPILLIISAAALTILIIYGVKIEYIESLTREIHIYSRWEYFLTQINVIMTYLRLMILPINQNLDYNYPVSRALFEMPTILSFLSLISILTIGILLFKKDNLISFGIIFFFLALSVESSFIPISDVINEHRLYLPSVGFLIAISMVLLYLFQLLITCNLKIKDRNLKIIFILIATALITTEGIAAYKRNNIWRDDFTLWSDVVSKTPDKARPLNNLAMEYDKMGRWEDALNLYQKAVQIKSGNPEIYFKIYINMAKVYANLKRWKEAEESIKKALKIKPEDPNSHNNLGIIYNNLKMYDAAVAEFKTAINLKPDIPEHYGNLGFAYIGLDRYQEAMEQYNIAISLRPNLDGKNKSVKAYNTIGDVLYSQEKYEMAIAYYHKILSIEPENATAHYNIGLALDSQSKYDEAIDYLSKAIKIRPEFTEAHYNLGNILVRQNKFREAISEYAEALKLKPDYIEAHINMGGAYAKLSEWDKAIKKWDDALLIEPNNEIAIQNRNEVIKKVGKPLIN
jgi:tetratricopeptide (TPR) repeat protein